ncbi:MAG: CaiB/BaiF CoA transferase family protein [Alphaproteobacteria bacterium]
MPHEPASSALADITVIDMSHVRAGPVCVRQLADWGANVIKIDRPGDPPDFAGRREGDYLNKHRNKRAMALNLKSEDGRKVLYRLVEKADVVVENFRPDIKTKLGFDYETLARINPRIIVASISAFGQDGPYKDRAGVDQIIQGMSGLMSITGEPGRGPMRAGIPVVDISAGLFGALGILVALMERQKSGKGQWVQTSLLESMLFFLDIQAARYVVDGVIPKQVGNEHPTAVPTNVFPTKDGYINIAPVPAMWGRICKAIGCDDLIDDPDFNTREIRRTKRKEINEIVESYTRQHDTATLLKTFDAADVPCGPIYNIKEAFDDPQAQFLGLTQPMTDHTGKRVELPRQPIMMNRTPSTIKTRPPEFAEHTDEILGELGFSRTDIAELRKSGAVE